MYRKCEQKQAYGFSSAPLQVIHMSELGGSGSCDPSPLTLSPIFQKTASSSTALSTAQEGRKENTFLSH